MQNRVTASNLTLRPPLQNVILVGLPHNELAQVQQVLTRFCLMPRQVLIDYWHVTEHAFFIENGSILLVAETAPRWVAVQVAIIGHEGMVGGQALLGQDRSAFVASVTQVPGIAHRLLISALQRLTRSCPASAKTYLKAADALLCQIMQTAACNARKSVAERFVQ